MWVLSVDGRAVFSTILDILYPHPVSSTCFFHLKTLLPAGDVARLESVDEGLWPDLATCCCHGSLDKVLNPSLSRHGFGTTWGCQVSWKGGVIKYILFSQDDRGRNTCWDYLVVLRLTWIVPVNEKKESHSPIQGDVYKHRAGGGSRRLGAILAAQDPAEYQPKKMASLLLSLVVLSAAGACSHCLHSDPVFLELCSERSCLILSAWWRSHNVSTHPCWPLILSFLSWQIKILDQMNFWFLSGLIWYKGIQIFTVYSITWFFLFVVLDAVFLDFALVFLFCFLHTSFVSPTAASPFSGT